MVRPWHVNCGRKYAWTLLLPAALLGTALAATIHPSRESSSPLSQQMGTICKFTAGPRAGDSQDYSPMQAPLNAPCQDGSGSTGTIVASAPKAETAVNRQMGTVCKFTAGPRTGTTQDYAPMQAPLDMPCSDGSGSSGTIIAAPPVAQASDSPQTGSACKFTSGPKAGSTHDDSPIQAPLGTACDDGAGSSGVIVAAPIADIPSCTPPSACPGAPKATVPNATVPNATAPSTGVPSSAATSASAGAPAPGASQAGLGSVCKLTSGPKAGTTYDFAPMQAAIGAPCNYGPDNTGTIIAGPPQPPSAKPVAPAPTMGSVCSFETGPLALTTADFSPKRAPLGTPCTDGHGSHGVIVEH